MCKYIVNVKNISRNIFCLLKLLYAFNNKLNCTFTRLSVTIASLKSLEGGGGGEGWRGSVELFL